MNIEQLISQAKSHGIELWLDGNRLRYRAQKGKLTTQLKAELIAHKKEIVEFLLIKEKPEFNNTREEERTYPLSHAQQRFWFMHEMDHKCPAYNVPIYGRIKGNLDIDALERSLDELLSRHQVLRSVFVSDGGVCQQHVIELKMISLDVVDYKITNPSNSDSEIQEIAEKELRTPFDFSRGPMFKAKIIKLDLDDYLVLVTTHHIILDGWSLRLLRSEIETLYAAYSQGDTPNLPQAPSHYLDYVEWERVRCDDDVIKRQLAYWTQTLDGISPIQIPTKNAANARNICSECKSVKFELPRELLETLKEFSRRNEVTLFMTMLTAFNVLLKWYSQKEDLCVATAISNRQFPGSENIIGTFENTILLRNNLSGNPAVSNLLSRTQKVLIEAYAHQDIPYDTLVRQLSKSSVQGPRSLYEIMFVLHEGLNKIVLKGLNCRELNAETGAAINDLSLVVRDNGAIISFNYKADIFEEWLIINMANHFHMLLEKIAQKPETKVSELTQLTKAERHKQLVEWNTSNKDYRYSDCVHELFEKQVNDTPDAIAIFFENKEITYRETNKRANLIAHYLQGLGVGSGSMVGLCIDRSPEMVIAILGIWKAGGTYIPLDPEYPKERLSFMLADAQIQILLTKSSFIEKIPELEGEVVAIDRDWPEIESHSSANLTNGPTADSVAYVIYTSGSTGTPKGVIISHSSFADYCQVMKDHWQIKSGDRILQLASLSFDVSLAEIFIELISGASTVLPTGDFIVPQRLTRIISEQKVTRVNFAPALWRQWVQSLADHGEQSDLSELRLVVVGSDVVPPDVVRMWKQLRISNSVDLVNAYGPTEATVTTTTYWVEADQVPNIIPIGRSLPGCPHYILDSKCGLVPVGVSGELHIGGNRLALGYLNQPKLTAEKFILDPFSDKKESRLYKTGDLARYLPDGNIEFLGRIDFQVKVRGFRIELGEIESALSQHPSVKETVIAAIKDETEEKRLVAYILPKLGETLSGSKFRQFLKAKLPEYMVPSDVVMLECFPLNPNGKIDRNALPLPDKSRDKSDSLFVAPRNEVEEKVAAIWEDVLNLSQISVNDNFFELGGHSLNATQVISRIYDAFRINLPIASIFETQNLADMAELVAQETIV